MDGQSRHCSLLTGYLHGSANNPPESALPADYAATGCGQLDCMGAAIPIGSADLT
jgi:hypothetical protein